MGFKLNLYSIGVILFSNGIQKNLKAFKKLSKTYSNNMRCDVMLKPWELSYWAYSCFVWRDVYYYRVERMFVRQTCTTYICHT